MYCTNCGQEYPEGTSPCPYCGAPATPAARPPAPVGMAPPTFEASPPALPASSGVSIASLVLGILGIALVILALVLSYTLVAGMISQFGQDPNVSQEEVMRLAQDPAFQANAMGILVCFGGAMLFALGGLILGIVGVSQEGQRPTQSGKVLGILGLVLSALPLLCCVSVLFIGLLGQG